MAKADSDQDSEFNWMPVVSVALDPADRQGALIERGQENEETKEAQQAMVVVTDAESDGTNNSQNGQNETNQRHGAP